MLEPLESSVPGFLCNVGRSGSGAPDCPDESESLPESDPVLDDASVCLWCKTGLSSLGLKPSSTIGLGAAGLAEGNGFHAP